MGTIFHVDLNSYFATVEQQQNPFLRGRPVGVVKDKGRTCVIAASVEAKKFGVRTGSLTGEARLKCPEIVLIPGDFDKYWSFTKRLKSLFESLSPDVEIFSLDEAFIFAPARQDKKDREACARHIQERIYEELGEWVTASVGISFNKTLSKLAGEFAPKGGFFEIDEDNLIWALLNGELTDICGIGPRLERKLKTLGVESPLEILFWDEKILEFVFGKFWGPELKRLAEGKNSHVLELSNNRVEMKQVGRTTTFFKLVSDEVEVRRTMRNLVEEVALKARQMGMAGRYVAVFLQGKDQSWCKHQTLKYYVRHGEEIFKILSSFFNKRQRFAVIRVGVFLGMLKPVSEISQCWLPAWQKAERVTAAVDKINEKYGYLTVRPASLAGGPLLYPEVTGYLGDKVYQFREDLIPSGFGF